MKTYELYHYIYGDVCSDNWFGKESKVNIVGYLQCEEEQIKCLVDEINKAKHSYYSREPLDDYDEDALDEDYYGYKEVEISSIEDIRKYAGLVS